MQLRDESTIRTVFTTLDGHSLLLLRVFIFSYKRVVFTCSKRCAVEPILLLWTLPYAVIKILRIILQAEAFFASLSCLTGDES